MARPSTGRIRAAVFLIFSVLAAGVASMVIYSVVQNLNEELQNAQKPDETTKVVQAARHLYPGTMIKRADLVFKELPPAYVPEGAFLEADSLVGRVPQERILANEFIREERLADEDAGFGLNALVPRHMRAVSIPLGADKIVSGFVEPGNYVDLLVTLNDGGLRTVTLMEAITLLAIDNRLGGGTTDGTGGGGPSITLAVSPEDAEKLQYASNTGTITLTLRNDVDVTSRTSHGEEVEELIGRSRSVEQIKVKDWAEKRPANQSPGALIIIRGRNESRIR
jgi:pilus assembly protein CpaB